MDDFTKDQIDKMSEGERQSFNARSQIGDIIVVRGDGWKWGKEECPPNFIVVKVPQITEAEAKVYEESLSEQYTDDKGMVQTRLLKVRKHALPKTDIDNVISIGSVSLAKNILLSKIITKVA